MNYLTLAIVAAIVALSIVVVFLYYRKYYMHIKRKEYYEDGNVKCEYYTLNGVKDGIENIYYPTKEINKTKTWSRGVLEGPFMVYFRNGKPYIEGSYSKGEYNGVYSVYDLNGSIISKKEY